MNAQLTFFYKFHKLDEWALRAAMAEFAANGQHKVVLTDEILRQMLRNMKISKVYRKALDEFGMEFCDSHAVYGEFADMCCPDPGLWPYMIRNHEISMEIAASFGVKTMTIHMGRTVNYDIPMDTFKDNAMRSLDALLPTAARLGITLCIENCWYQTSSTSMLLKAIDTFKTDSLGVCYDAGHANVMSGRFRDPANRMWGCYPGREPEWNDHVLEDLFPHIVVCHFHDNDGINDLHELPGTGNVEWNKIIPVVKTAPRLRTIQSEVTARTNFPSVYSIRTLVETFRKLLEIS